MKLFGKLVEKQKKSGKKMSNTETNAKMNVVKSLSDFAKEAMGKDLSGFKKVTVASPSSEGLKKGLKKAEEMTEDMSEDGSDEKSDMKSHMKQMMGMGNSDEESSEDSDEEVAEHESGEESADEGELCQMIDQVDKDNMSSDEIDNAIKKLLDLKKELKA